MFGDPISFGILTSVAASRAMYVPVAQFPLVVGCLTGLTSLSLRGNLLSDVPYGAAQLRALRRLDLASNPFHEIPRQLQARTLVGSRCSVPGAEITHLG